MTNIFTYPFLGVFFLRIFLGIIFIYFGYLKFFQDKEEKLSFFKKLNLNPPFFFLSVIAGIEIIGGIFLVIGLFTQIVAILFSILMLSTTIIKLTNKNALKNDIDYYLMLFVISFSLIFLGPGILAISLFL